MADTPAQDLTTRRVIAMLANWLPLIGRADLAGKLQAENIGDPDEWTVNIHDTGIAIDTGYRFHRAVLGGTMQVTGLRVLTWKTHPGNRWNPPEQEDVTELETQSVHEALLKVADLLARDALGSLPPLTGDLADPSTIEEF